MRITCVANLLVILAGATGFMRGASGQPVGPAGIEPTAVKAAYDPYSAPPLPAGDPMNWKEPTTTPALRERLKADAYHDRYEAALAKTPALTPQQAATIPPFGMQVTLVDADSQASRLGIKKGDLLLQLDGHPFTRLARMIALRNGGDQTLTFKPAHGDVRQVTIQPGLLGVAGHPHWDAYISYLRSPGRMESCDADFRVAGASLVEDAALAETALWHAWQRGFRGYPLAAMMAWNAHQEGRDHEALAFAILGLKEVPPLEREPLASEAYDAAVTGFKFELARDLLKQYPAADAGGNAAQRLDHAISAYRALPAEMLPNPIEQLRAAPFPDATAQIVALPTEEWKEGKGAKRWDEAAAKDLRARHRLNFEAHTEYYARMILGPPTGELDLALRFNFSPADGQTSAQWAKAFSILIVDHGTETDSLALRVTIMENGVIELTRGEGPDFRRRFTPAIGIRRFGRVHIAVVGHRMEVVADGRRILYGPAPGDPATRKLTAAIHVTGLKGDIDQLSWRVPAITPAPSVPKPAN